MPNTHELVERGQMFVHSSIHDAVGAGASVDHVILTNGKQMHLVQSKCGVSASPGRLLMYEGPSLSDIGSQVSFKNMSRRHVHLTPTSEIYEGPTVVAVGTFLDGEIISGTKQSGGVEEESQLEWVLKADSQYLVRYTNNATGDADASVHILMYEKHVS